jgi:outer membrane lipoprotein SlyB
MRYLKYVVLAITVLSVNGCAPNIGAGNYTAGTAQQVSQVSSGVIVSSSQVEVQGSEHNLIGTIAGAATGAVLGSTIGQGTGSTLAAIGGGVAGGYAGNRVEAAVTKQQATRYVIKLTNGSTVAVVQKDNPPIPVGTKVQVISGNPAQVVVDTSGS